MKYRLLNLTVFLCACWPMICLVISDTKANVSEEISAGYVNSSEEFVPSVATKEISGNNTTENVMGFPENRGNHSSFSDISSKLDSWSSSGWRPILNPKARESKQVKLFSSVSSTTVKTVLQDRIDDQPPFRGSPPLYSSGWIPILDPKLHSERQGRTKFIPQENDYDDIITASPIGDVFEVVVGASMHDKPNSRTKKKTGKMIPSILDRSRRQSPFFPRPDKRELTFPLIHSRQLEFLIPYDDNENIRLVSKLELTNARKIFSNLQPERLIIDHPVGNFQPFSAPKKMQRTSETILEEDPESILYIPFSDLSSADMSSKNKPPSPQHKAKESRLPLWEESAIDQLFTLPPLDFHYSFQDEGALSLEKLFPSVLKPNKDNSESTTSTTTEFVRSDPVVQEGLVLQAVMNAPPDQVIINTGSGPHSMFAYSTVHDANGYNQKRKEFRPKIETKHFVTDDIDNPVPKAEERNTTVVTEQGVMSTESLAYILIGTCLGLSFLCLMVVLVTMRCRRSRMEQKAASRGSGELINGWVSNSFSKESRFVFENDILHCGNRSFIDPWRCKKTDRYNNSRLSPDASQMLHNGLVTNGIWFNTLSIGPCKQIKRTTVIPANTKALVTDGHTAVMRELSSDSSILSSCPSDCSSYLCPTYQPLENEVTLESLDIQEELFDRVLSQNDSKRSAEKVAEKATAALQQLISNPSNTPSTTQEVDNDDDDKNSIIHWSSNNERLI